MRRYGVRVLMMCGLLGMAGCSYVPAFPDLWPFNDGPDSGSVPAGATQLESVTPSAEVPTAAVETPSTQPEPPAQTAQLIPQPAPTPSGPGGATPSEPGAAVYIISPVDGAVVTNPVRVIFGLDRMGIAPATVQHSGTGHHHLLVNTELPPLDRPIPVDDNHRHFSGGQTETSLNLPLGEHTLQLVLGDHSHTPHQPPIISRKITITVQ